MAAASPGIEGSREASSRANKDGTKMAALAEAKYVFCGQLTIYRSEVRVIM